MNNSVDPRILELVKSLTGDKFDKVLAKSHEFINTRGVSLARGLADALEMFKLNKRTTDATDQEA